MSLGVTLACGTGACATVVAAVLEGHAERVGFFPFLGHYVSFRLYVKFLTLWVVRCGNY
jgi:hypothetical protein